MRKILLLLMLAMLTLSVYATQIEVVGELFASYSG